MLPFGPAVNGDGAIGARALSRAEVLDRRSGPLLTTGMRTEHARSNLRSGRRVWQAASCVLGMTVALVFLAGPSSSQAPAPKEQARVPTSHANVHKGPSSGQEVLVLVPRGTVLPVIGRRGEWIQVRLSPELRKTGMVMRWYENEDNGWMHDSTVEITEVQTP